MSEELGRPSYKARPATPRSAVPPPTDADDRKSAKQPRSPQVPKQPKQPKPPRSPRSPKPVTKAAAKPRRQEDPPAEPARPPYPPVKQERSLGYVLWHLLRIIGLLVFKLARAMIKTALLPFHHAG